MTVVTCAVCPHHCTLDDQQFGLCRGRKNSHGQIINENYGKITAISLDPIEKKPLHRFMPGSQILSVGSFGCNLKCPFCQNHHISMASGNDCDTIFLQPEKLAQKAFSLQEAGNIGLAYTYNEPLIGYEYVLDCAREVHKYNMKNILVTNGYAQAPILFELLPFIDAVNIDVKGFTEAFYKKLGGDLQTVKRSVRLSAERTHVEVTTLIIPRENDSHEEMDALSSWLAKINPDIPLHISRFIPRYQYAEKTATSVDSIYRLVQVAQTHLRFVYAGNC